MYTATYRVACTGPAEELSKHRGLLSHGNGGVRESPPRFYHALEPSFLSSITSLEHCFFYDTAELHYSYFANAEGG